MIIENSLKVKNYKCFGEEEQGFERIFPINIIIGKNNSGKSSLLDLIEFVSNSNSTILGCQRTKEPTVIIETKILETEIAVCFSNSTAGGGIPGANFYEYGKQFVGSKIWYQLDKSNSRKLIKTEKNYVSQADNMFQRIVNLNKLPIFTGVPMIRINAERNIIPELISNNDPNFEANGVGATNLVRMIINRITYDSLIIEKNLLNELNKIISPELVFTDIVIQEHENSYWEIYLEEKNNGRISLSKMGSGIKSIILVLLNLIAIPTIHSYKISDCIFGFEELENNLHPSLQRKLFNYLAKYVERNSCKLFLTTHSSLVIDLFNQNLNAQIIHLENINNISTCRTVNTNLDGRNILKDLDYKPSDLLLSNGIVWVEGPSDAIYLELAIELYKREFTDTAKPNFCIQALSTAIWKYAGFADFDWSKMDSLENKLISLAKINHNHIIVIDNDGNYEDLKPSCWKNFANGNGQNKARLINESMNYANHSEDLLSSYYGDTIDGKLFYWINDGTFETYLEHFIKDKGIAFSKYFHNPKDKYFEKKRAGTNSSKSKVELAAEIAQFVLESDCSIYDIAPRSSAFFNKIQRLSETIKGWN